MAVKAEKVNPRIRDLRRNSLLLSGHVPSILGRTWLLKRTALLRIIHRLAAHAQFAVLLPPINLIFKLLQQHSTVQIWLYEQLGIRIEGKIRVRKCGVYEIGSDIDGAIQGFDEFMNLVIDDAIEVKLATKDEAESRRQLGMVCSSVYSGYARMLTAIQVKSCSRATTSL